MSKVNWNLDPTHSEVQFKVKHMMITNVTGNFKEFTVNANTNGDDFSSADISFSAKTSSIHTGSVSVTSSYQGSLITWTT